MSIRTWLANYYKREGASGVLLPLSVWFILLLALAVGIGILPEGKSIPDQEWAPRLGPLLVVLGLLLVFLAALGVRNRRDPYGSYRPVGLHWYQGRPWDQWALLWFLGGLILSPLVIVGLMLPLRRFAVAVVWAWGVPWSLMLFAAMAYGAWLVLASLVHAAARRGKKAKQTVAESDG